MSLSLEDINVSLSFDDGVDVSLMQSTSISLDTLEFVWGLHRGQIGSYTGLPANSLRLQPALIKAIEREQVALLPPIAALKNLFELQTRNAKASFGKRQSFTEVIPFQEYEYRILPLKNVSFYIRDPATRKISPINKKSLPSFTFRSDAHPAFVLAYASDGLNFPPTMAQEQLKPLGNILDKCLTLWTTAAVPLVFYKGSWVGEFGRSVPAKWRGLLPKEAPVKVTVKEDKEEEHTVKRRKLDGEASELKEANNSVVVVDKPGAVDQSNSNLVARPDSTIVPIVDQSKSTVVESTQVKAKGQSSKRKKNGAGVTNSDRTTASKSVVERSATAVVESAQVKVPTQGQSSKRKRA